MNLLCAILANSKFAINSEWNIQNMYIHCNISVLYQNSYFAGIYKTSHSRDFPGFSWVVSASDLRACWSGLAESVGGAWPAAAARKGPRRQRPAECALRDSLVWDLFFCVLDLWPCLISFHSEFYLRSHGQVVNSANLQAPLLWEEGIWKWHASNYILDDFPPLFFSVSHPGSYGSSVF